MQTPSPGRARRREAVTFYLLISPWLVGLLTFTLLPIAVSLGISFTRWDMLSPPELVGLRNYARMLDDRLFWQSLSVTARYTLMYVPTELIGGLLLALLGLLPVVAHCLFVPFQAAAARGEPWAPAGAVAS